MSITDLRHLFVSEGLHLDYELVDAQGQHAYKSQEGDKWRAYYRDFGENKMKLKPEVQGECFSEDLREALEQCAVKAGILKPNYV